jgi:translocation and assembly module TamB
MAPHAGARRRRQRRRDWVGDAARILCFALATVGVLPLAAALMAHSAWARGWATKETERLLRAQGFVATYEMAPRVLPLSVELTRVRIESNDGGSPALECHRIRVRPKLFALLAGKLAIDEVDLDAPAVRLVMRDGAVANLPVVRHTASTEGPLHAPFANFAVTDATVDVDIDEVRAVARSLDMDVTAEDDPVVGSTFEIAMRVGRADVHRSRLRDDGATATDDDALCSVEGRLTVQPDAVVVRRLQGMGSADLDAAPGTTPECDLPVDDKRRVELSLNHLRVVLPSEENRVPLVDGHVMLRAPIALAERAVSLPETDGWIRFDADTHYDKSTVLPELTGTLDARDVRVAQWGFAKELHSELTVRHDVVQSPTTTIRLGNGTVTLSDTVVEPLAKGVKLDKTRLDVSGVDFTAMLRELGVHQSAHVAWDIRELHAPLIAGTLAPLKLDGDFTAKTYSFGVYDRPAEDPARERIFGFSEAEIASRLGIRPDGLKFMDVRATLPRSRVEGAFVSLGFHNELRVDAPRIVADLDDLSPIGPVEMQGKLEAGGRVSGVFNRPEPEGDIKLVGGLVIGGVAFGDVSNGRVKVDVQKPEIEITGVHAKQRDSAYDVPTAKLRFGGSRGFVVDAVGSSGALGFRDLLSMFGLDDDPRFDDLDASLATRADVHVALGGPEDACGAGYIGVEAKGHLTNVTIYGEHFAQGDADVSVRWHDRQQGIAGSDLDLRSFVLNKVQPPTGTRAGATGTLLGSASLRRGGALTANIMVEGVPLSRVDALGRYAREAEGSVSGVAQVTGQLDDSRPDAGFVARADLDIAGTRVRDVALPGSHLDVRMTHRLQQQKQFIGRTRCGAPIGAPFDKAVYAADSSSRGEWTVNGQLLGSTARLHDIVVTRAKAPHASGRVSLRGVDLGALAHILGPPPPEGNNEPGAASPAALSGQLWGELIADDIPLDQLSSSRVRFFLGPMVVSRGGQKLTLRPPRDPVVLSDDTLSMPQLQVTLDTPDGFRGGFVLSGSVARVTSDPTLALDAQLEPVDLAILERVEPKVDRASGKLEGRLHFGGKAISPVVTGALHATAETIEVHGLPSAITDLRLDMQATPTELSLAGTGKFAGGSVTVDGSLPVRGFELGALDSHVVARGVRMAPIPGIAATFDADLDVTYSSATRTTNATLPRVTGDVAITSFSYTRPIALTTDLTSLGSRAKRTQVDVYDPARDFLAFDLRLRSRAPIVIKNNLVDAQLAIESETLEVTGTNQRLGLRGALRAHPGGRFHFQQSDFEVRQAVIRFDDPTRIDPNVDVTAVTEYRRYTDSSAGAGAGVSTGGPTAASTGSTRGGSLWRITLHAFGDADNLRVDMTSEPSLSQEDIVLLLAVGMTHAELDQLQASSVGASLALNYLGATSGADRAVKQALPIIDDFRFGSAYSRVTGNTEPQVTIGKRLTNDLRANVTAGLSQDRELRSNIEWRLNNRLSVQGSYDNINDTSSSTLGNLGVDLRWRLEFE